MDIIMNRFLGLCHGQPMQYEIEHVEERCAPTIMLEGRKQRVDSTSTVSTVDEQLMTATDSESTVDSNPIDTTMTKDVVQDVVQDITPVFAEILEELKIHKQELGGVLNFSSQLSITHKVKNKDFRTAYTDYEYIYLTVLGLSTLHQRCEEIISLNNFEGFTKNPGTQLFEHICGMTMHADREGTNMMLRSAPATLIEAFTLAKRSDEILVFFLEAFDRCSDPCLEGRIEKIMRFLEKRVSCGESGKPPWEDVALKPLLPTATAQDIIGEHLRVFLNECTWLWCCEKGLTYNAAKGARLLDINEADFSRFYNASSFEHALQVKGVVLEANASQWEAMTQSGEWRKYNNVALAQIWAAERKGLSKLILKLGPKGWNYELNFETQMQRNSKTGKERAIRCVQTSDRQPGTVSQEDMRSAITFFVEMDTLPAGSL